MNTCGESLSMSKERGSYILRRVAFVCGVILAAFVASPVFGQSSGSTEWKKLVDAAKAEGTVVVSYFTDPALEPILRKFEEQFGIKLSASAGRPNTVVPKILTEQKNGQFNWDVLLQPVSNIRLVLEPTGGLEPILPFLVLPEVKDDSMWHGGVTGKVDIPFVFYDGLAPSIGGIDVNRDKVSRDEVNNWDDLLKAKWKGKIGVYYPGRPAELTIGLACTRPNFATDEKWEDFVRAFFAQKPVTAEQFRTVADWLLQGRFDVVVGSASGYLDEVKLKLKRNIEDRVGDNFCQGAPYGTGRSISVPKNPPHPNAAKLFINWYLSKDIQEQVVKAYWSMGQESTSRRKDVTHPNPDHHRAVLKMFETRWLQGQGIMTDGDEGLRLQGRVIELAKEAGY